MDRVGFLGHELVMVLVELFLLKRLQLLPQTLHFLMLLQELLHQAVLLDLGVEVCGQGLDGLVG